MKIAKIFNERFDKEKFFEVLRFSIYLILLIVFVNTYRLTLSRYTSEVDLDLEPQIAFFIADVGSYQNRIKLDSILPRIEAYLYSFTVSNFKDDDRANVNIEYDIEFIATTNLPLNIKVFKNTTNFFGNGIITVDSIQADSDGMFLRTMKPDGMGFLPFGERVTNTYIVWVEFPEHYKHFPEDYQGVIELLEVSIVARQVI